MKKILVLLLMVSVVAGMTLPAMATDGGNSGASAGSSSNGGTNKQEIDTDVTGANTATHTVNVVLTVEPQTNMVGKQIGTSGDNVNGAVADFDAIAKADDANSGNAVSGGAGSGATSGNAENENTKIKPCCQGENGENGGSGTSVEAETGKAVSVAKTGEAETGDALSIAKVSGNENKASADDNLLKSGKVDQNIDQTNVVKQITPIEINNDQKLIQKVKVDGYQDASSNPIVVAKQKKDLDLDLDLDFDIEEE